MVLELLCQSLYIFDSKIDWDSCFPIFTFPGYGSPHNKAYDTEYALAALQNQVFFEAYLIFVIFFTRAKFLESKIYTKKTHKLQQNTQ